MHAVGRRERARASRAGIVEQRVHGFSAEMRALDAPLLSGCIGAQHKSALHRTDEEQRAILPRSTAPSSRSRPRLFCSGLTRLWCFSPSACSAAATLLYHPSSNLV